MSKEEIKDTKHIDEDIIEPVSNEMQSKNQEIEQLKMELKASQLEKESYKRDMNENNEDMDNFRILKKEFKLKSNQDISEYIKNTKVEKNMKGIIDSLSPEVVEKLEADTLMGIKKGYEEAAKLEETAKNLAIQNKKLILKSIQKDYDLKNIQNARDLINNASTNLGVTNDEFEHFTEPVQKALLEGYILDSNGNAEFKRIIELNKNSKEISNTNINVVVPTPEVIEVPPIKPTKKVVQEEKFEPDWTLYQALVDIRSHKGLKYKPAEDVEKHLRTQFVSDDDSKTYSNQQKRDEYIKKVNKELGWVN